MKSNNSDIDSYILQLRESFYPELEEKLDRVEAIICSFESVGLSHEGVGEMCRIVHSLKGLGMTLGIGPISIVAHHIETKMEAAKKIHAGSNIDIVSLYSDQLKHIDSLRHIIKVAQKEGVDSAIYKKIEKDIQDALYGSPPKGRHRILAITQSRSDRKVIETIASEGRDEVVFESDPFSALMRVFNECFDLMICANTLSVLNGPALIGAVKIGLKHQAPRCILLSSGDINLREQEISVGPDKIISRSQTLSDELGRVVHELVHGRIAI